MHCKPLAPLIFTLLCLGAVVAPDSMGQKLPEIPLNAVWKQKVAEQAPKAPQIDPARPRKVLVFSLATGFQHWCIPHTEEVIEILGKESGAYTTEASVDVEIFRLEHLKKFDAVVLNNNCPRRDQRDFFVDVLVDKIGEEGKRYAEMSNDERKKLATLLYRSLVDYVANGGGLVLMHGAIANFGKSDEFSMLAGGSFGYHPPQQELALLPVTPGHPVLKPFDGKPFVHIDEPYVIGGAYDQFAFRPLLQIDPSQRIQSNRDRRFHKMPRYVAWIKPHKKGRVFFSSPSHNAQSFERPELLLFLLNGMQYATGDLKCDDTPLGK